jgi:hypothetical protein
VDRLHLGRERPSKQELGSADTRLAVEGQQQDGLTGEVTLEPATVPATGRRDGGVHCGEILAAGGTHLDGAALDRVRPGRPQLSFPLHSEHPATHLLADISQGAADRDFAAALHAVHPPASLQLPDMPQRKRVPGTVGSRHGYLRTDCPCVSTMRQSGKRRSDQKSPAALCKTAPLLTNHVVITMPCVAITAGRSETATSFSAAEIPASNLSAAIAQGSQPEWPTPSTYWRRSSRKLPSQGSPTRMTSLNRLSRVTLDDPPNVSHALGSSLAYSSACGGNVRDSASAAARPSALRCQDSGGPSRVAVGMA